MIACVILFYRRVGLIVQDSIDIEPMITRRRSVLKWITPHFLPADQVIMKSIALGWPAENFPANAVVSERKSVEEATVFVGF
jgi:hypothetical protein